MSAYPSNCFMIASADNIDYVHHFARVYCGKQQSSWHGTTVQIARPKPCTLTTNTDTVSGDASVPIHHMLRTHQLTTGKRLYSMRSPMKPTSPRPKKMRRRRTGVIVTPSTSESVSHSGNTIMQPTNKLSISEFKLKSDETKALAKFREIGENYVILKAACTTHTCSMVDFQTFFSFSNNLVKVERSNIIYYKVLDQKCDDKETLLSIINNLYNEFIATKKQTLVLLEGDQATYVRLQSLKAEYGSDLSWFIPFPGDWHILKNYQEVLVKIYFEAGLLDLAKSSGYTPTSITSNFKRTHHFLMEVWESLYRFILSLFLKKSRLPKTSSRLLQIWSQICHPQRPKRVH